MKTITRGSILKTISTVFCAAFLQLICRAQESAESNGAVTTIGHYRWYMQPWAVVTGIALILIIIVALVPTSSARDNNVAERVSYLKTSKPDQTSKSYS